MNQIFGQEKQTKQTNNFNNGYPNNQQINNNYYYGNSEKYTILILEKY